MNTSAIQGSVANHAQPRSNASRVEKLAFNATPASVRERIVRFLTAPQLPANVERVGGSVVGIALPLVGAVAGLAVMAGAVALQMDPGLAEQPVGVGVMTGFFLLGAVLAVGFGMLTVRRLLWKPPSWPVGGVLVTPFFRLAIDEYDLTATWLPMNARARITNHYHNRAYQGSSLAWLDERGEELPDTSFMLPSQEKAEAMLRNFEHSRDSFGAAMARGDHAAMQSIEPFYDALLHGSWTAPHPTPDGPRSSDPNRFFLKLFWPINIGLPVLLTVVMRVLMSE